MCNKLNCWALLPFWPDYWTIILCLLSDLQLSEKDKPYVDIQGLTASTMEILLDFVYTETVHVTVENVQELLPAACLLQLKGNCQESAETAQLLLLRDLVCLTFCKWKTDYGRHEIYKQCVHSRPEHFCLETIRFLSDFFYYLLHTGLIGRGTDLSGKKDGKILFFHGLGYFISAWEYPGRIQHNNKQILDITWPCHHNVSRS